MMSPPGGETKPAAPRRRETRPGTTRKVNRLSEAQLERKRANDREAQRIIRQKTKDRFASLENQVKELKAKAEQCDALALENAQLKQELRRFAAVERENAQLRHHPLTAIPGFRPFADPGERMLRSDACYPSSRGACFVDERKRRKS